MNALKLPFEFDADVIKKELSQFSKKDYEDIYNPSVTLETLWLIHFIEPIIGEDGLPIFLPNEALKKCPYLLSIFEMFQCQVETFRIHTLDPGASIQKHRDTGYSFEHGQVRLHIPVQTNDKVEILVDDVAIPMQAGECWYCNFHIEHEVRNNSDQPRIHIILDCIVNDWLAHVFGQVSSKN
ncbi:aspartyl/asparaginyl beta-hydroxylase domain-containing protein [Kordia sp.]|uniref:aspartyl/asparaginyl beta-hydroxylase domain-containing protein n=1 Tax=Kordia sp. TaxID=1965332 RepID=UPI003B5C2A18